MNEWSWGHPAAWPWLLLAPVFWGALLVTLRRLRRRRQAYGAALVERAGSPLARATRWTLLALLGFLTWMEPRYGEEQVPLSRRGLDLVFCLDVSRSMLARDIPPTRLDRARRDILSALPELLGGDRVALIAFAGEARLVAPLTHDLESFRFLCEGVDTDTVRLGGSDLAAAIRRAIDLADDDAFSSTVCILMTDGEDLTGAGRQAAREAAAAGIVLHTLGYGSTLGSKITVADEAGSEAFLQSRSGDEVVSSLDSDSLREMATAAGGDYLRADAVPLPLVELKRKRLDPMLERSYETAEETVHKTRYQWVLFLMLLLLLIEIVLHGGSSHRRGMA